MHFTQLRLRTVDLRCCSLTGGTTLRARQGQVGLPCPPCNLRFLDRPTGVRRTVKSSAQRGHRHVRDDEIAAMIAAVVKMRRGYADSRSWPPDRTLEEHGVAQDFVNAAAAEPGAPFSYLKLRRRGEDPPDCEARDVMGRRIAIEITELVDELAVKRAARGVPTPPVRWNAAKLRSALARLITKKDIGTRLKDGPWDEYIVVIYSAEMLLDAAEAQTWLAQHRFDPPTTIHRAYLSLDYMPNTGYPLIRLLW